MLKQYADYEGIRWRGLPNVVRKSFPLYSQRRLSALAWGGNQPQVVLLHGGAQNAHTWDSVAMALDRAAIAIDLPGHGHSDWRQDHDYSPSTNAETLGEVIKLFAGHAEAIVGMSLGGATVIALAARYPRFVKRAVIVDVTPASFARRDTKRHGVEGLLDGPGTFKSFDEILLAAASVFPERSLDSLRVGVLHNSRQLEDGRWVWRYDREIGVGDQRAWNSLWEDLSSIRAQVMLVRGGKSEVVQDEDVDEFLRFQPNARIEVIPEAGHNVQSDRPVQLAALIADFVETM